MIASIPEKLLERNAAIEVAAARVSAVNTATMPAGYASDRVNPSTCFSRTRPMPWMKKSTPNAISVIGRMNTTSADPMLMLTKPSRPL